MQTLDLCGAEQCFLQAIVLVPTFAEAWANLGHLRSRAFDASYAEHCFRQALQANPDLEEAQLMLGVLLMNQKRFQESEQHYRAYLLRHPGSVASWSNLGVLLACLKREQEAEHCYRQALTLDSQCHDASFNLSYILLRQQRWEEGWQRLEDRWQYPLLENHFACPRWHGESLVGKTMIIGFEMGHGDMIFYSRYLPILKVLGVQRLALICHPGLKKLFATLADLDQIFSFDDVVPAAGWDYWTPPMSLPLHCATRAHNIPAAIPYLQADPALVAEWHMRIPTGGLRVGLVWQGNPQFENDIERSIGSLQQFMPWAGLPGVQFFGLQKGAGEHEPPPEGLAWLALSPWLNDFADTAAALVCLDLVISVDTAVAHLAGALGVPCWILLPDLRCDWRWLCEGEHTPWYPDQTCLFRQPVGGGWESVIAEVRLALSAVEPDRSDDQTSFSFMPLLRRSTK